MTAAAPAFRVIAAGGREARPHGAAPLVACAAIDGVAAGILLLGTPLPQSLEVLAAAVVHATAVLVVSGSARARPSRRWLCIASVLAVPFAGAAVATAVLVTRGRGSTARARRRRARRRPAHTMASMRRLERALSPCDALESGDEEQRRAALAALSRRGDPDAIALLRRAAAGRDPDLALSAALALDEIAARAEREVDRIDRVDVRYGAG